MRIKALESFFDIAANKQRNEGDVFDVGEIRGNALTSANNRMKRPLCVVCDEPEKKPKKPAKKKEAPNE